MKYGMITNPTDNPFDTGRLVTLDFQSDGILCKGTYGFSQTLQPNQVAIITEDVFNHLSKTRIDALDHRTLDSLPTTPGLRDFMQAEWYWMNEFSTWEIRFFDPKGGQIVTWLSIRSSYCDRGNVQAQIEGVPSINSEDGFPRYFMNMEIAKREMKEWILWRVFKFRFAY